MQYIDYKQLKDEQQETWQPNHTPTTEWQNPTDMLPSVTILNRFRVRLGIAEKENHCNRTVAISMFKYAYRSNSPGIASKIKLHAIPKQNRNTVFHQTRPNDHNEPFGNQIDFQKQQQQLAVIDVVEWQTDIDNFIFLEQTDKTSFSKNETEMMLEKYKINIIHPSL